MENHIFLSLVFILAVYIHHSQAEEDHDLQAVDIIGHCDFNGLKFYNNECQKFVQCAKPFLYLMHCSEGSYFSQRDQKCSYISELGCVEEQSDFSESSVHIPLDHATILKDRSSMMSPMCTRGTDKSCGINGFHEVWNEKLSTQLIQSCSHGWSCLLRCDVGYLFDRKSEQCLKYS
ncbi:hypothetical protein TCAL_16438 [Tigriopus californicus]|uniref:Chitin-binding type-2 domain-containing protein n=1 Tax=Tigriopus californicus TaxID=6832 RepID=A0A553P0D3_TIGCA|nr:hypothetical protein TCAL_16438 [Tigriopus californicus]